MYNSNCNKSNCTDYNYSTNSNMFDTINTPFPNDFLYGHAYTPNQIINKTYTPESALKNGTLFPELVSTYTPYQSIDFINYLRNGGR